MRPFRPGLMPTAVVLLLLPLLISLGFWQLGRGAQKERILAVYEQQRHAQPLSPVELAALADPAFRKVRLHGTFDSQHSLLLDNRIHDGQAGVELLQPFQDAASGMWLLVNRGWLPWPDRRSPPGFETPVRAIDLVAWIYLSPGTPFQLRGDPSDANWPKLVTLVDPQPLWQTLERDGYAHELRMEPGPGAYALGWPVVSMGPEKHRGYAVQWFAMATALAGLYLYLGWHIRKPGNNKKEDGHGHDHHPSPRA